MRARHLDLLAGQARGGGDRLYALTPAGAKKWNVDVPPGLSVPAVAADGTVCMTGNAGTLTAISPAGAVK